MLPRTRHLQDPEVQMAEEVYETEHQWGLGCLTLRTVIAGFKVTPPGAAECFP